jgi:hypothetical protein
MDSLARQSVPVLLATYDHHEEDLVRHAAAVALWSVDREMGAKLVKDVDPQAAEACGAPSPPE